MLWALSSVATLLKSSWYSVPSECATPAGTKFAAAAAAAPPSTPRRNDRRGIGHPPPSPCRGSSDGFGWRELILVAVSDSGPPRRPMQREAAITRSSSPITHHARLSRRRPPFRDP